MWVFPTQNTWARRSELASGQGSDLGPEEHCMSLVPAVPLGEGAQPLRLPHLHSGSLQLGEVPRWWGLKSSAPSCRTEQWFHPPHEAVRTNEVMGRCLSCKNCSLRLSCTLAVATFSWMVPPKRVVTGLEAFYHLLFLWHKNELGAGSVLPQLDDRSGSYLWTSFKSYFPLLTN